MTAVKNKMQDVSNLLKNKTGYDAKISDIKSKYFTTDDYKKFTSQTLVAKINKNN